MHELSLAEGLIEILTEEASKQAYRQVRKVVLEIGEFSHVAPDAMRFCFEIAAQGSVAEGAVLDLTFRQAMGECRRCGESVVMHSRYDACPACGAYGIRVVEGEDMSIKYIEVV